MKTLILIIIALFIFTSNSWATKAKKQKVKPQQSTNRLKTDHDFSDTLVNGKFQTPLGSLVNVDDEKTLEDLIGVRKDFKDRIKETEERN